ncbi:MAG: GDP-mannose 4,6-dehydratase [Actinomycetes bacterium]
MRAFVTGASGFVGPWLTGHLRAQGDEVFAPEVEITDAELVRDAVAESRPDAVYHLAAVANVGESWGSPLATFAVNATGTLNVLEAARALPVPPTVLLVCSAEVYGRVGAADLPLTEDAPLRPVSPYAASKVAAEFLGMQAHLAYGLPVIRARAFNHIGPGQAPTFVVSSLARQVAEVALKGGGSIHVGNLTPQRDFTDVRDVVRAYRLLVERGTGGEVYNVCSGEAVAVAELADRLIRLAGVEVEVQVDPDRVRAVDVPVLVGDPGRLVRATGWRREHELDDTLLDVLDSWRSELAGSGPR